MFRFREVRAFLTSWAVRSWLADGADIAHDVKAIINIVDKSLGNVCNGCVGFREAIKFNQQSISSCVVEGLSLIKLV